MKEGRILSPDLKGYASLTMGDVILRTINNFPEPRYRPNIYKKTNQYTIAGIDPAPYSFWATADGIGTKPELAERLYEESKLRADVDPSYYRTLAYDTIAMIEEDDARFGRFTVGIAEVLDTNNAKDEGVIANLAQGAEQACNEGRFALINGETAELGYRTSGYGDARINWNAVGISIVVPEKLILGENLKAGQPIVAFREKSIRSNGLSKAREILEMDYLLRLGFHSKRELIEAWFKEKGFNGDVVSLVNDMKELFGHDPVEQILLPWHKVQPETTRQLLAPSRLYGSIIYDAQGGIFGERKVKMVAAAHVTGGGVPEKSKRMVDSKNMGVSMDAVFPDPQAVSSLLKLVKTFPKEVQKGLKIDDKSACKQWNRGIGFIVVTQDKEEAKKLIDIAEKHACEAKIAGEVTDKPKIVFRKHEWPYEQAA